MKKRLKKLLGLGIIAAVAMSAVPVVDVAAVGEANDPSNHEHKWNIYQGREIDGPFFIANCDIKGCDYWATSKGLRLAIHAKDEIYSGKPYSGLWIEGREEWKAAGIPNPQIDNLFYVSEGKIRGRGKLYASQTPPTEVGNYFVGSVVSIFFSPLASFKILPPKKEEPNGNTQKNNESIDPNGNDSVNNENNNPIDNTPENNEDVSQNSDIPEGNEPTKPAFDNKVCMDKVKDMAEEEVNK